MRVGVIGGTGLYSFLEEPERLSVETPYGPVGLDVGEVPGLDARVFFLNRHGAAHGTPPHRIDHRRNIDALARCKVDAVFAVHNVGGLRPGLTTGHFVIPHDFVDLTGRADGTFHDDEVVHVDLSEPYCPRVRKAWIEAARSGALAGHVHDKGIYVAVRGPRLETPAEVNHLASLGDVVGMTGCPEAALARERGLCYASLSFVANPAAGVAGRLEAEAIRGAFEAAGRKIHAMVVDAMKHLPETRDCGCSEAPGLGRLAPRPLAEERLEKEGKGAQMTV